MNPDTKSGRRPVLVSEAKKRFCPFLLAAPDGPQFCAVGKCMAWRVVHDRIEREDHSGARNVLNDYALATGRHVRREGPPGSMGRLILDEAGLCMRLETPCGS